MKWAEIEEFIESGESLPREGWERLLGRLRARLMAVLNKRRTDPELAEDVVQESLLLIWQRWHTLRRQDRVDSWATSILLNRLRTHLVRRREQLEVPEHTAGPRADPLDGLVRSEGAAWLFRAVAALPPSQREPVDLRLLQGLSPEVACRALGITRPCLRRRLHEGVTRLRRRAQSPAGRRAARAMGIVADVWRSRAGG